jgi:hypothetical protein
MFRHRPLSCRGLCLDDTCQQVVIVTMVQAVRQQVHVKHALLRSVAALTCATSDILDFSAVEGNVQQHIGMMISAGVCTIDLRHVHELLCRRLDCRLSFFQCYCGQSDCQAPYSAVKLALNQHHADARLFTTDSKTHAEQTVMCTT